MIPIDANILLYSYCEASPHHAAAKAFLDKPLIPAETVADIQSYRQHPRRRVLGFTPLAGRSLRGWGLQMFGTNLPPESL